MTRDLFIGRQPIVDINLQVIGYELLFRSSEENRARIEDANLASSQVIVNTYMEMGLELIVGSQRAFINLTRPFLTGDIPLPMSPEQVALEVAQNISVDAPLIDGLKRYRRAGYPIVLDGFTFTPKQAPLIELADYVKLDVLTLSREQAAEDLRQLRAHGVAVIAERVETQVMYEHCRDLGCTGFQGFFFCRPRVMRGQCLPSVRATVLTLLGRLMDPATSVEELERVITQDVTFSYRLLRYVNCASFALRREIVSLREAIILLGSRTIRNWASLILLSRLEPSKPVELLRTVLVRARMAELLALRLGGLAAPEQAFTVGLFSALDAIMEQPMEELLDSIPLSAEIKLALLDHVGELGELLERVLGYERAQWHTLESRAIDIGLHTQAYLEAVHWADESNKLLQSIHER